MNEPIKKLWEEYRNNPENCELRDRLIEHYQPLVVRGVDRLCTNARMNGDQIERDDLLAAGLFGLLDAVKSFDPNGGVPFRKFSSPYIVNAFIDQLRVIIWESRIERWRMNKMNKEEKPDSTENRPEDREGRDGEQG